MDGKELIWVDEEFAERFKEYESKENKLELQKKALDDYLLTVTDASKREFRASFNCLEEDVAIYKGLMISVKQAFEKAKDEQLKASYDLWEKFEDDLPSIKDKTEGIIKVLTPLHNKLTEMDALMQKVDTFNIDKLAESIRNISDMYGANKEMVQFLLKNFKRGDTL